MRRLVCTGVLSLMGFSASAGQDVIEDLKRCDTHRCVEDLAVTYCFRGGASAVSCETFIEAVRRSPRQGERILGLPYAAALGAMAERVGDPQERDRLLGEQKSTYERLLRDDPNDSQALLGLAALATDRKEKIALLKRAAAADPKDEFALRALAALANEGSPDEQAEALKYVRRAYESASPPHRWRLARDVSDQLMILGMTVEARQFARSVLAEMDVDGARQKIDGALRPPPDSVAIASALGVICDENTIALAEDGTCVQVIDRVTLAVSAPEVSRSSVFVDSLAEAILAALAGIDPKNPAGSTWRASLNESAQRLKRAGPETALLLYAQAELLRLDPTAAQERIELLKRAVMIAPENGEARGRLAVEYMSQNRPLEAIGPLEAAIPLLPPYKRNAARSLLATALRAAGQPERAEAVEQQFAEHD